MTSAATKSRFLDLRGLAALERTRFTTRQRIEGAFSGRHVSKNQGGAGEFVDYREYSLGEDLRKLDWKVLARSNRAYVRLYQDETNLRCMLAIDTSASMLFGGRKRSSRHLGKLEYVQYLSTALSYIIARGQDQVGLALLGEKLREVTMPGGTAQHLARVHGLIESIETTPSRRMATSLGQLFEQSTRRGVLLLISDFLMDDLEDVFAAVRLFRHRQWEVMLLHVVDPDEERLPEGTAFRFEGLEGEGIVDCSPAEIEREYARRFADHTASVRDSALAAACDYRPISTAIDYLHTLRSFLVERAG